MDSALIGHTGFVGSTLQGQRTFDQLYRSNNIGEIDGQKFSQVVCSAAPAQKWLANKEPEKDWQNIKQLITHLQTIESQSFILISTVDVFKNPVGVYEDSQIDESELQPYGLHRRWLEKFVQEKFKNHLIVRLPGLVGPGLRKNIIFDFLNENNLNNIDSRGIFQFYPMVRLWQDIETAMRIGLQLVHLTAEPVSVAQVSKAGFDREFTNILPGHVPAKYDLRTMHAESFRAKGYYQYNEKDSLEYIRKYAESEAKVLKK